MTRIISTVLALGASAAVLAGCALIPAATGIQDQQITAAQDAAAKADVLNAKVAFLTYSVETGAFPASVATLYDYGYAPSEGVGEVTFVTYSELSFCIQAQSASGAIFSSKDQQSAVDGPCA